MIKYLFTAIASLVLLLSSQAFALNLGDSKVLSKVGEPIIIEVEVLRWSGVNINRLDIDIGGKKDYSRLGVFYGKIVSNLKVKLQEPVGDKLFLEIKSKKIMQDTHLDLVLELGYPGFDISRRYQLSFSEKHTEKDEIYSDDIVSESLVEELVAEPEPNVLFSDQLVLGSGISISEQVSNEILERELIVDDPVEVESSSYYSSLLDSGDINPKPELAADVLPQARAEVTTYLSPDNNTGLRFRARTEMDEVPERDSFLSGDASGQGYESDIETLEQGDQSSIFFSDASERAERIELIDRSEDEDSRLKFRDGRINKEITSEETLEFERVENVVSITPTPALAPTKIIPIITNDSLPEVLENIEIATQLSLTPAYTWEHYQIQPGDTLEIVAVTLLSPESADYYQMLLALHDLNPGSFENNNITLLKPEGELLIPRPEDLNSIDWLSAKGNFEARWSEGIDAFFEGS